MEGRRGEADNFGPGDHVQAQLAVNDTGRCLRQKTSVGDDAGTAKEARTARSVQVFDRFRIQMAVGFFGLGLEDSDNVSLFVEDKVAAAGALADALGMDSVADGRTDVLQQRPELGIRRHPSVVEVSLLGDVVW